MSNPMILDLVQGSDDWHHHRATALNASDAPAMMGASKYCSRSELMRRHATGIVPEVNPATQRLFDAGHAAEAAARPLIESEIGDELYPVIVAREVDGLTLSASLDGQTMDGVIIWEHKLWSELLAAQVRAGELEPHYYWQLEQQLLVSGASRVIFTVSDGADKRESMDYGAFPWRSEQLIAGWKHLQQDLADYQPDAPVVPAKVGRAPATLPALRIEVTGGVTASNLSEFRDTAIAVFQSINTDLHTDQDFADAEQTVKWCGDIEDRLDAAKAHALSQTASIDKLFAAIDDIKAEARAKRLELDRLVKARKEAVRGEIVAKARDAYRAHEDQCRVDTGGSWTLLAQPDFGGAIKGKRSIASMQDAVDTLLANAKITANESARKIRAALACLDEEAVGFEQLFADRISFISKPIDDVRTIARARIAEHKAREDARLEQERERIRQEEVDKLAREQVAATASVDHVGPPAQGAPAPDDRSSGVRYATSAGLTRSPPANTVRIKLGDINARIAPLSINADGLAQLGFRAVGTDRAAKLYNESDWPAICAAITRVVQRAADERRAA